MAAIDDAWNFITGSVRNFVASGRQLEEDSNRLSTLLTILPDHPDLMSAYEENRALSGRFTDVVNDLMRIVDKISEFGYNVKSELGLSGLGIVMVPISILVAVGATLVIGVAGAIFYFMKDYSDYRTRLLDLFQRGDISDATLRAGLGTESMVQKAITPLIAIAGVFVVLYMMRKT